MNFNKITPDWLNTLKFSKQNVYQPPTIKGVLLKNLKIVLDGRGSVIELWSEPWLKKEGFLPVKHGYVTTTDYGVVKGWHLHKKHTDQLVSFRGKVQVVLVDLRDSSSSFGQVNSLFLGIEKPALLLIPPGVMHGWKALSRPETAIINYQTHLYDPADEYKFPWNCVLEDVWEPKNG